MSKPLSLTPLSKSKLIAFRQCAKRGWLEVHQPQLAQYTQASEAIFRTGHEVGRIAQELYDPQRCGTLVDLHADGADRAIARTKELLAKNQPIFEAGFAAGGARAFADALLPVGGGGSRAWRMVEVKASGSVKPYQIDDIAIQSFVARESGVPLTAVAIAHIDTAWVYPGNGDYRGLLVEQDLTETAVARAADVKAWIAAAHDVVAKDSPPEVKIGKHCTEPFSCGFLTHCQEGEALPEYPITWLPRIQSSGLKTYIEANQVVDMRNVPEALLTPIQRRVRDVTLSGVSFFDAAGALADLAPHPLPAHFLDFETIAFGVPRWPGTRPFQLIPFQFSVHHVSDCKGLSHEAFLDLSGDDPSRPIAEALVGCLASTGPIFVYHAAFERTRIIDLSVRVPEMARQLVALSTRLVDLLPIAQSRFYHPTQQGSWSIKKVLPAIAPELRYENLVGVQDGGAAMEAYLEAIASTTTPARHQEIHTQLTSYCALDSLGMVVLWGRFSGSPISLELTA